MHASDNPDPWASLAESLGVGPGSEPQPQRSSPPARPAAPRSAEPAKAKVPPASATNWDALADDLGIGPSAGASTPRAPSVPPRRQTDSGGRGERLPAAEQREPHETRRDNRPRQRETGRSRDGEEADRHGGDAARDRRGPETAESSSGHDAERAARDDDRGERTGRRRRGRRGGRGRRDRDGGVGTARDSGRDAPTPSRDYAGGSSRDDASISDRIPDDEQLRTREAADEEGFADGQGGAPGSRDEEQPRRRRRRGRRGGRGRARGTGEVGEAPPPLRERADDRDSDGGDQLDDEPVPTSYGLRSPARTGETRDQPPGRRSDGGQAGGSTRGRRRRRRGGEGRAPAETGRSRRPRRGADERSGTSRSSRMRRADFAPVSGTYDEDDEGLEFLGVEEASRASSRRETRTDDDDVLAQSGLDSVREVPSWVEAIGIVIAGNLDARSRGRGEAGRHRDR